MTRSKGFTLIELLVVVAVIGIIAAIGIVSYNGYVKGAKMKAAENVVQQVSLAQAEYKSDYDTYITTSCPATAATSLSIEKQLFSVPSSATERTIITDDIGYYLCTKDDSPYYEVQALERDDATPCIITLNGQSLGISRNDQC